MKTDPWYLSKRIYAAVVMILAMILGIFGYDVSQDIQDNLADIMLALAGAVSGALAIWSKIRESKKKNSMAPVEELVDAGME